MTQIKGTRKGEFLYSKCPIVIGWLMWGHWSCSYIVFWSQESHACQWTSVWRVDNILVSPCRNDEYACGTSWIILCLDSQLFGRGRSQQDKVQYLRHNTTATFQPLHPPSQQYFLRLLTFVNIHNILLKLKPGYIALSTHIFKLPKTHCK